MEDRPTILPTPERLQHSTVTIVSQQITDSDGNIGAPFQDHSLLRMLEDRGAITAQQAMAGSTFMDDFYLAGMEPLRAAPMEILGKGVDTFSERRLAAKDRLHAARQRLGIGSACERAAWNVLGLRRSIAQWVITEQGRLREETAKGILIGALCVLAAHYGYE